MRKNLLIQPHLVRRVIRFQNFNSSSNEDKDDFKDENNQVSSSFRQSDESEYDGCEMSYRVKGQ